MHSITSIPGKDISPVTHESITHSKAKSSIQLTYQRIKEVEGKGCQDTTQYPDQLRMDRDPTESSSPVFNEAKFTDTTSRLDKTKQPQRIYKRQSSAVTFGNRTMQ